MIRATGIKALPDAANTWVCASCRFQRNRTNRHHFSVLANQGGVVEFKYHRRRRVSTQSRRFASTDTPSRTPRNGKLPVGPARTRFAPSPTGYMHIGGLRTALFSYLLAKRTNGQFLLRIEDTDQKRLVADAEQRLCEDLKWAGLHWDEGPQVNGPYGPYKQSERTSIYHRHAQDLLDSGSAYRCFCTPQTSGPDGGKAAYVTSGCYQDCSSLSSEEAQDRAEDKKQPFTVRLKVPENAQKRVYSDLIYGKIQRLKRSPGVSQTEDDSGIDAADTILVKSDGTPTYHFANVVDDHLMEITHVIRGTEWMASTPLHYDLYTAFGWEPPTFAHVGLLVDENKAKLSKRSNTGLVLDVRGMREEQGILPEVLNNFLALLGWSNPGRNDVLEMNELIRDFDLKFTKGNTIVRTEKLWYLQKQHVSRKCEAVRNENSLAPISELVQAIRKEAVAAYPEALQARHDLDTYCAKVLLADSKSYQTLKQYIERNRYFFHYDPSEIQHSDSFSDGAASMAYQTLSRKLFEEFDFSQAYREPPVAFKKTNRDSPERGDLASQIDRTSTLIHAAINHNIWRALANPMWLMLPATQYEEAAKTGQIPPMGSELEYIPFTSKSLDLEAYAKFLGDKATNPALTTAGVEETVKAYKEWNKGMMRFLREKLSYGLPGPGVGQLMAVLGYEECCRRLSVTPQKGGGW